MEQSKIYGVEPQRTAALERIDRLQRVGNRPSYFFEADAQSKNLDF
jgi:hypothetical protein